MANEIKVKVRRNSNSVELSTIAKTSRILEDAISIISQQVDQFRIKSARGDKLAQDEAYLLNSYIKSLVGLSKEEREREKAEKELHDLSNLSDQELLELAQQKLTSTEEEN